MNTYFLTLSSYKDLELYNLDFPKAFYKNPLATFEFLFYLFDIVLEFSYRKKNEKRLLIKQNYEKEIRLSYLFFIFNISISIVFLLIIIISSYQILP